MNRCNPFAGRSEFSIEINRKTRIEPAERDPGARGWFSRGMQRQRTWTSYLNLSPPRPSLAAGQWYVPRVAATHLPRNLGIIIYVIGNFPPRNWILVGYITEKGMKRSIICQTICSNVGSFCIFMYYYYGKWFLPERIIISSIVCIIT